MNVYSDLNNIENTVNRLRTSREKLLNEAIQIRKCVDQIHNVCLLHGQILTTNLSAVIDTLEDAAAVIETELNANA